MKTLSAILIVSLLLFVGCKKDNSTNNVQSTSKTYLLKTATYTYPGLIYTDTYTYDGQNRIIEFYSESGSNDYRYTYDSNNNLLTVATSNINNGSLILQNTYDYTYSGSTVTATKETTDVPKETYSFTINDAKNVTELSFDNENTKYTYDIKGNVSAYTACCSAAQSEIYTYDEMKNPLSMIVGINYHLRYLSAGYPSTFVNNLLTDASGSGASFVYMYNSDNFPVSAVVTNPVFGTTTIKYDYIIK